MYFPIGWPKAVNLALPGESVVINHICCDAVKILVAAVGDNFLGIYYANPLIPIAFNRRSADSVITAGTNKLIIWKPDSRQLAVLTTAGTLLLYQIDFNANESGGILTQVDPPAANLKRDSAELFVKENIPRLSLRELGGVKLEGAIISTVCCISLTELLIATDQCELIRINWAELEASQGGNIASTSAPINLRNIPFYVSHDCPLKSLPPIGGTAYVAALEYSPFIGGCAVVFSDSRAAFLIATHLHFEAQNMHGFWVSDVEDATVCSVNHKFRLLAYGRLNSNVAVYAIEDATGGLEFSHRLSLNTNVIPGALGGVNELKWSPDGCVLAVSWQNGGISLWSTFGALLMSSLSWDFGINVDLVHHNPLQVYRVEWCTEGYQLFLICRRPNLQLENDGPDEHSTAQPNVLQLNFVKSTLTMNPCMASHTHLLLQGEDTLYLNQGDNLEKMYFGSKFTFPNSYSEASSCAPDGATDDNMEVKRAVDISSILSESKYWSVLQLPFTYAATNWPIRYSAIDAPGLHLAVAGRTGLAHYSMLTKKWKLFGNESQEKDFVVSGGLLWWQNFVVMGCYSLLDRTDEIRCYPEECKLDNQFGNKIQVRAPVISLNMFRDQLIALTADGIVSLFVLQLYDAYSLSVDCAYEVDVKSICIHPACIVSLTVTNLKNDITTKSVSVSTPASDAVAAETIIVNVCGRILMIQRDARHSGVINSLMASCLASCVECFWLSNAMETSPMRDCLWLYSGTHGMRVWLPILPPAVGEQLRDSSHRLHTFMSKRIMLSFPLKLYPLVILFDNVIVLGVENETTLYTSAANSHFSLPFCLLERKSQVYLHRILRQLIKRNLGYSAWEIAKSCRSLPYFPHALELLLHEVLEEEATSKEPIPDALLPSILDFIREFPVYLQTIVQCARKTEIALWPYLFSMAGKPKDLFQQCLQVDQLDTAASYLIILQNLEPSMISKQYATLLLDIALQHRKWELAKDLVRFLKAIDPNEIDSPRSSMVINMKIAPPSTQTQSQVNQHADVFNLVLGPIARERSFSTTVTTNVLKEKKEKSTPAANITSSSSVSNPALSANENVLLTTASAASTGNTAQNLTRRRTERSNSTKERKETFSIDIILQRHARELLQKCKLIDLGYMSAFLDFHLVTWLTQEAERAARLDDFVAALTCLHEELQLPSPFAAVGDADDSANSFAADYTQLQQQFLLDYRQPQPHASSHTSESGYFSLALMDTPTSTNNGNVGPANIASIKEDEEMQCAAIPTMGSTTAATSAGETPAALADYAKVSRANFPLPLEHCRYRRLTSLHDTDVSTLAVMGLDPNLNDGTLEAAHKILPEKLSIKMRYLLQLFIEANCTDYALVLSILLLDAASIGRIINVVMRSESLATCTRIESALKHLTQWCFDHNCFYRPFMISLQPHIYLLDQHIQNASVSSLNNGMRKPDNIEMGEPVASDPSNVDELNNLLQSSHITATSAHPPLNQFPHEGRQHSAGLRPTNLDFTSKAHNQSGSYQQLQHGGTRTSKEQAKVHEPGGCCVM